MKRISKVIILLVFILISLTLITKQLKSNFTLGDENNNVIPQLKSKQTDKQLINFMTGDIFTWINKDSDDIKEHFGEPKRKDLSAYGYTWWIYKLSETEYVQFGVEKDEVVTVFAMGADDFVEPFQSGTTYDKLNDKLSFKNEITYHEGLSFYTFKLNDEDLRAQPLLKVSKDLFVQSYFDTFTNELLSVRLLTGDILLRQRFYEMEYRGNIPDILNDLDDKWAKIEKGLQQQIFDLTNVVRKHHQINELIWDDDVSEVAYKHSEDMSDNNYFSHYRQDGDGLKERLAEKDIYYLSAGENIAAQHSDAMAAVHGWINSEGHREALLNDDFNYLGVGVHRLYYTQNFIYK